MDKKIITASLISIVLAGGIGFYGGMEYDPQKSKQPITSGSFAGNGSGYGRGTGATGQQDQRQGQRPAGGQGMRQGVPGGGFVAGQVISKDDSSVTIKTKDGSSQIIFFSDTANIDKSVSGSKDDLSIGQQITANGKVGTDGSMTAETIQIRPDKTN